MKLSNQYCSREQAIKLKELGILNSCTCKSEPDEDGDIFNVPVVGTFYSCEIHGKIIECMLGEQEDAPSEMYKPIKHYSVAELSVMLGDNYPSWSFNKDGKKWIATTIVKNKMPDGNNVTTANEFDRYGDTQAQALAELLIATIEIDFLKPKDINERLLNS